MSILILLTQTISEFLEIVFEKLCFEQEETPAFSGEEKNWLTG
jgi:hypothetical protein